MALVDIVEDALGRLHSHDALAKTLGVSVHEVTRVLQRPARARLAPVAVIRAARLTKRNICDALRTAGEPALADELESLLDAARSPAQQAILDDLHRLPGAIRQGFVDLIADRAAAERARTAATTRTPSPPQTPSPRPPQPSPELRPERPPEAQSRSLSRRAPTARRPAAAPRTRC